MAISDFKIAGGHYALAYGKHVVGGILAGYNDTVSTAIKAKYLLGMGEWNGLLEVSYDGSVIDPANYTFHPGTQSTGAADALQGQDSRFPDGIFHNRIAYVTVTFPDGMGSEPEKFRAIAECLKMPYYDNTGTQLGVIYSTNPADVFADLVRRNTEKLGLTFSDYIDWAAYYDARVRYAQTVLVDDGAKTPTNIAITNSNAAGTLANGVWYYRIAAIKNSPASESVASPIKAVQAVTNSENAISWDAVSGADKYRIYYSFNNPEVLGNYFESATNSFTHSTTSGALTGNPVALPTGDWEVSAPEFQVHRAFTESGTLTADALSSVMFDAASEWVRDGKKYRIILPNQSTSQHRFTIDNTTEGQFSYWKIPIRSRANRVSATFRNLDTPTLKQDNQAPANDFARQSRVGIVEEQLALGSMNISQMKRITNWRMRDVHTLPRRWKVTGQNDAAHLLVGDVVSAVDRQAGTRDEFGGLPNGVLFSGLNIINEMLSGSFTWVESQSAPSDKSPALQVSAESGSPVTWTSNIAPFTPSDSGVVTVWIFIGGDSEATEISFQFGGTDGVNRSASFRLPQTATSVTLSGSDSVTRIGNLPQRGNWVPLDVDLAAIGVDSSVTINKVGGLVAGSGAILISPWTYLDESPVLYRIQEIEDADSDGAVDRLFTLFEHNADAYDPSDGFTVVPPSISSLSWDNAGGQVNGTIANGGGTGDIHIMRKLGAGGTYSEIDSVPFSTSSFTDAPGAEGTYYYQLTQDGVAGSSLEYSVVVDFSTVATITSLSETGGVVTGNVANHGGTGTIRVHRKLSGGTYSEVTSISSATASFNDSPPATGTYYYKLTQDGLTGESAELSIAVTVSATAPTNLQMDYAFEDGAGFYYVGISWTNNGAGGNNVVQKKKSGFSYSTADTVSSSTSSDEIIISQDSHSTLWYIRVYNDALPGQYSNELLISVPYFTP